MSSFGETLYSDASTAGKITTGVGFVFAIIIGIIMLVIGIALIARKDTFKTQKAQITAATCTQHKNGDIVLYDCTLTITYTVGDKTYTAQIQLDTSKEFFVGPIDIQVDSTDPTRIRIQFVAPKTIGYFLIGIAVFVIAMGYLSFYLARKSKFLSAGAAVGAVLGGIRG